MIYNLGKNNNTRDIAYFGSSSDYNNFKIRNPYNFSESSALTINANKINKNIILSIGEISNYVTNGANKIESLVITDVNLNPDREYIQKIIIYDNTNNRYDYIYVKFLKEFNNNWYLNFFKLDNTALSSNITILPFTITYSGENTNYIEGNIWGSNFPYNWVQRGVDIDGEAAGDNSGRSVSLSSDGSIVAIGAWGNDGNGSNSGHVRVYEWNETAWVQRGVDIDGEAAGDNSGHSVSLSSDGSIVAIGAYGNNSSTGHVRVYEWNGITWVQRGVDIDGESSGDVSGWSVSLSSDGTIVAIGAIYNDGVNGIDSGHVRVYEWNGTAWIQRGADIDGEVANDEFGYSVSLSSDGSIVAIGASRNDAGSGIGDDNYGSIRVYEWNETAWVQRGTDIDGEARSNNFGSSVSLSSDGSIVAGGAPGNSDVNGVHSGHVRVYEWNETAWVQRGVDIDGEAADDYSGFSVSLNSNGSIVAIGAWGNDGNGNSSGHVRVYEWNGTAWVQRGVDIDGEAAGDEFGYSVSLSSDGSIVSIGAWRNDGINGIDSGHVRVYTL